MKKSSSSIRLRRIGLSIWMSRRESLVKVSRKSLHKKAHLDDILAREREEIIILAFY